MRLTLRTLLAYLDGILEPKDAEELGKKIEESDYATGLVHRVRDVMRRLRLGAPALTDRGPGPDANTVAEYLDNTLPADQVTDFEKVCLDSDTHLAEVAASHQILTLVLGEPAEIDEATRQRMYDVRDVQGGAKPPPPITRSPEATELGVAPSLSLDLGGGDDSGGRKPRPRPTVPEYLREPRRRRWLTVAVPLLGAACLILLLLGLLHQYRPGTPLGDFLVSCHLVAPQAKEVADKGAEPDEKIEGKEGVKTETLTPPTNKQQTETGKEPATKSGAAPAEASPPAKPEEKPHTKTVEPAPGGGEAVKPPKESQTKSNPAGGTTTEANKPVTILPPPPAGTKPNDQPPVPPPSKAGGDKRAEPAPLPTAEPEPLGRLLSSDQVLLSDNRPNGWIRVGVNQMLIPQHVLALPTYRPKIGLTSGVTVEMLGGNGGTHLELLGSSSQGLAGIRVVFGRVVLMPLGKGGTRLRVDFGNRHGTVTFIDAESTAALDVYRRHEPGTNPESDSSPVAATLFASGGPITWEETVDGKPAAPQRLAPSERIAFDGQTTGTPTAGKELPKWIAADGLAKAAVSPLDRRASPKIAEALPTDQPARIKLLELATARPQWEVKWLSLRCLGYVGQFHDMVMALNDVTQKLHWPDYIDTLRSAVDRDPQTAAAVRMELEKQYPQQAAELYRMLWRYTDKQLTSGDDGKGGEDAKLVHALDDDLLVVRVLANANLKEITGKGEIYRPEFTAARRQQAIRSWRQRLEAKEIRLVKAEPKARPPLREKVTAPAREDGQQ